MTGTGLDWQARLANDGYAILPGVLTAGAVSRTIAEWDAVCRRYAAEPSFLAGPDGCVTGARNLLRMWPAVLELARQPGLLESLIEVLGPSAGVVRGLFFDKPPGRGWALPWHKDYNIAVRRHGRTGRFTKPTTKAGVPHVEAPVEVLSRMVTARIHLDDMVDDNGPLRVIRGSHRADRSGGEEIRPPVAIHCRASDAVLMRPLLTHASGHSDPATTRHRRTIHLECAPSADLPDGYKWHDFVRLAPG